jgi:hypothetical protein
MGKITNHVLLTGKDAVANRSAMKEATEPSNRVIENILNYSKALKVKKCRDGKSFVEYLIN